MLNDTLLGFKTVAESATERNLVVWMNEYFGAVARGARPSTRCRFTSTIRTKCSPPFGIPQRSRDTFRHTIRRMREKKLTFAEAIVSAEFFIVDKSRLHRVKTELLRS